MPKQKKANISKLPASAVPYARGFRLPTAKQRNKAVSFGLNDEVGKEYQECTDHEKPHFSPLPKPSSIDDWLAQYDEEGQTYSRFLRECPWISRRKVKYCRMPFTPAGKTISEKYPNGKIYLLPLGGGFGDVVRAPDFEALADYAARFFGLQVEILPAVELHVDKDNAEVFWIDSSEKTGHIDGCVPRKSSRTRRHQLEARFHRASGNFQLQGSSVLIKTKQVMPPDAICLMALTMCDIYDTPPDLFVAGLAAGNHRVGVFSLRRYAPSLTFSSEHWHQISKKDSRMLSQQQELRTMLQRSCKLLVHEVAHLLGLDHCIWYSCCMNGSGHLAEDFRQSMHLCPVDLRKLQSLCGFDVVKRYQRLQEFFRTHGLVEEEMWVKERIRFITEQR